MSALEDLYELYSKFGTTDTLKIQVWCTGTVIGEFWERLSFHEFAHVYGQGEYICKLLDVSAGPRELAQVRVSVPLRIGKGEAATSDDVRAAQFDPQEATLALRQARGVARLLAQAYYHNEQPPRWALEVASHWNMFGEIVK